MITETMTKAKEEKTTKTKIAFVSLFANISGATLAMLEIIDKLLDDGDYEVIVVTGSRGPLEAKLEEKNIPVFKCLFFSWLKGEGQVENIKIRIKNILSARGERQIYNILKNQNVDILHINTGISPIGIKSAKALQIPVIWHLREEPVSYFNREPYDKRLELICIRQADEIITISKYIYDCYREKFADNARIIYDGVDTEGFEKLRTQEILTKDTIHMALCGYNAFKGHMEAERALSIIMKKGYTNVYLHFYGKIESSCKKELISMVDKSGLGNHVIFEGYVDDMPKKWAESDIGLMCSDGEGFGRATVEAMATGALVIGADKGATPEIIENGKGFLYEKGNAEQLAEKIIYAIENPDVARKYAALGQRYITEGTFSMDRNIVSLKKVYQEVLERKKGISIGKAEK